MNKGKIENLFEFASRISAGEERDGFTYVYRGHAKLGWKLQAKVHRTFKFAQSENRLLMDLIEHTPEDFAGDTTTLERLVRSAHHGLPTRLLDASFNPYIALFFACREQEFLADDSEVIRIGISKELVKDYDSDTISCVSNLARLEEFQRKQIVAFIIGNRVDGDVETVEIEKFNKFFPVIKIADFVRREKSYFENKIKPLSLWQPHMVLPKKSNRRILAQSGAFLVAGLMNEIRGGASKGFSVEKFIINAKSKKLIINDLDAININLSSVFPDIDNVARYLSDKYA